MKQKHLIAHFLLFLGLSWLGCNKPPDPPTPPTPPPTPFNWDTYDWMHSFYCHSPITATDSIYFHGFLDGKEVCIVAGKDGYMYTKGGPGLSNTSAGYMLNYGFGHETKDSVCVLYFYTPPRANFLSASDFLTDFQLGECQLMDETHTGWGLEFNILYNVKENGNCNTKIFYTDGPNQSQGYLRLVEKEVVEVPNGYMLYFKFELDALLYGIEKYDSLGNLLPFCHLTNGELAYKTFMSK